MATWGGVGAALVAVVLSAGCGSEPVSSLKPAGSPAPSVVQSPTPSPVPSFLTPESAMVYLADAWNRHDLVSLKHVTDPSARDELDLMHNEATHLQLKSCTKLAAGDYDCTFRHDYPVDYPQAKRKAGEAIFRVGPARRSGWYMTVLIECG